MRQAVADLASQPIKNWSWNPRPTRFSVLEAKQPSFWNNRWGTASAYSLVTGATDGPPGISSYARLTVTGVQGGLGFHLAENPEVSSPNGLALAPATAGETVTLSLWVRSSVAATFNFAVRPGISGSWIAAVSGVTTAVTAGAWQRLIRTYTVPAGATGLGLYVVYSNTTTPPVGATLDVTGMVYTRGDTHPDVVVDGDSPGWRWLGAAGFSPSVGYPYTLESIAGTPLVSISGVGISAFTLAQIPALAARTTYVVTDRAANATPTQAVFVNTIQSSVNQTGQIRIQATVGGYEFRPQFNGGGGAGAAYVGLVSRVTAAGTRNILVAAQVQGLTQYDFELNGGMVASDRATRTGMSVGTGYDDNATPGPNANNAVTAGFSETPVVALQFIGYHEQETRRRITAWLARKYGAPVPAGY